MIASLPPGLLLIAGAVLIPLIPGIARLAWTVLLPIIGLWGLIGLEPGNYLAFTFLGAEIVPVRADRLSLIFGYIFHIAAILSAVYALHLRDTVQQVAGLMYAGSGIGAVFAGDLLTLFVYWEAMAVTSVFLIWARGGERAYRAGMRYLIIQIGSGVLLLSGAILQAQTTGSIAFDKMVLDSPATWLIFLAFGIKCAFPLVHNWLQDAYPEATITGTVFLSAFTTKAAVYALARGFPGTELLIYIGAAMTAFPIFYAVIENDLRRVLAYSLNNQLGFMVVAVGIGTPLAINGAAGHAFAHILYKALLFMSMGAVLYRVGTIKGSELGGLYKSMPFTTVFCIVGAASISAFPLFSGFVTKSLTLSAVASDGYVVVWLILMFASAGVFHHSGIKIPYFAFFAHDSGKRCREAPLNMLVAMGITAFLCIGLGVYSPFAIYSMRLTNLDSALSGNLPALHADPCDRAAPAPDVLGVGVRGADPLPDLSAGTALDQSRFRLDLPSRAAVADRFGLGRRLARLDRLDGGVSGRHRPNDSVAFPPPRPARNHGPDLAARLDHPVGRGTTGRIPADLLPVVPWRAMSLY